MITNIVDQRKRRHRWKTVNAIFEATFHDNTVADADQAASDEDAVAYDQIEGVSLAEAIRWAQKFEGEVTLFIYDEGGGITAA